MKKHLIWALAVLSTTAAAQTDDLATRLAQHGTFIVGTEGTYPPFTYHDADGRLTGYDVEVSRALAKKLGVKLVLRETPWNALLAGLNNDRFDAVANQVSMTSPERRAQYDSTLPYSYSGIAIADNKPNIRDLNDLRGLTGGLAYTSNFADLARSHGATVEPVEGGLAQEMSLVAQGRVDFTLNDRLAVRYYRQKIPGNTLHIVDLPKEGKFSVGFILRKGQTQALARLNEGMRALKEDGTLTRLSKQFFGEDVSVN